jgi:hypothetical protein
MEKLLKRFAQNVIIFDEKYNADITRISHADPSKKTPICAAKICRRNDSAEAEDFQASRGVF